MLPLLQCLDTSQRLCTEKREHFHMVQFAPFACKSAVTLQRMVFERMSIRSNTLMNGWETLGLRQVHCTFQI